MAKMSDAFREALEYENKLKLHIVDLQAENRTLREALRPFISATWDPPDFAGSIKLTITMTPADYRAAKAVLENMN